MPKSACCTTCRAFCKLSRMTGAQHRHIAYFVDIVERLQAMQPHDLGERSIVTGVWAMSGDGNVEAAGIEEVILYFNFGAYSHTNTRRMMERFAREVMPHFAG